MPDCQSMRVNDVRLKIKQRQRVKYAARQKNAEALVLISAKSIHIRPSEIVFIIQKIIRHTIVLSVACTPQYCRRQPSCTSKVQLVFHFLTAIGEINRCIHR